MKDRGPVIRNMDQKHIMISYCNAPEARPDLVQQLADYLRDVHKYDVWKVGRLMVMVMMVIDNG